MTRLPKVPKALSQLVADIGTVQSPTSDYPPYHRRILPDDLHLTMPGRRQGAEVGKYEVEIGWTDIPAKGDQPVFAVSLSAGAVWFVGKRLSGRSHALKAVMDDASIRYPEVEMFVVTATAEKDAFGVTQIPPTPGQGPYLVDSTSRVESALFLRQLADKYLRSAVIAAPALLIIDRVDRLLRELVDDDESYVALQDLLKDGASRMLFAVVTADAASEGLTRGGATIVNLTRSIDRPFPIAKADGVDSALIYSTPLPPIGCGMPNAAAVLSRPRRLTWKQLFSLADGAQFRQASAVPIGVDWVTHNPVWIGGGSVAIQGDWPDGRATRTLAAIFKNSGRFVVQLRGYNDASWRDSTHPAADLSLPPKWSRQAIEAAVTEHPGGVIVVQNIDSSLGNIDHSREMSELLLQHQWIVLASSQKPLYNDYTTVQNHLALYSELLWLDPATVRASSLSIRDIPSWQGAVSRGDGDAYLVRTAGTLSFRMPLFPPPQNNVA